MEEFQEDKDLEVSDILGDFQKKKKKINSKKKGNRVELELTKILTARFGKPFSRSVGSGNRWGQVSNLPTHAKTTLTGDICPPEGFKWVIECKGGYEDKIDLNGIFKDGCSTLDGFIEQSQRDCEQSKRLPVIVWKRSFKPWLAMVQSANLPDQENCTYRLYYREWVIVQLDDLLKKPDNYWFEENK